MVGSYYWYLLSLEKQQQGGYYITTYADDRDFYAISFSS
jgi:hypothetical protein